jgi:predicted kinase
MAVRRRIILLTGLPGSGKSTWAARQRVGVLGSDQIRKLLTGSEEDQSANRLVFGTLRNLLTARVKAGAEATIIDATSLTAKERRSWIRMADALDCDIESVYFDTPLEMCRARNAARSRVVPDDVMNRFAAHMTKPAREEGFSRVTVVPPEGGHTSENPEQKRQNS